MLFQAIGIELDSKAIQHNKGYVEPKEKTI